ncbi:amidase [Lutimaribacter saemankumensis]|uniref:Amidase n=1 Tax=Lutimaribacter saemankumensis TaxID=490829 RepID=A0A1G8GEK3_9RHOB|nr:amidase [Lutimaribacter saemankumensis]SDH92844.1 amidase [Lutimaribacter saemankumensis]
MSALLKVSGLRAGYGRVPVLHGVDLSVEDGEILGILGHNGMGKSTLLKALMGIIPAKGGSMMFDGQDIGRLRSSGRAQLGIGYVPQGRGIFPNLSVRDNLRMGIAAHDMDEDEAIDRVLADFPRLERLMDREGGALSGGEQQLLALARCLVSDPDMILLDEPTEGIQPSIIDEIIDLLKELNRREGLSIVLVEQSLDFITALSDRILLIQKGKIMGEVSGSEAADPALIEEFTGLGAGGGKTAMPASGALDALKRDASAAPAAPSHSPAVRHALPSATPHKAAAPAPLQERMSYMTVQRPTHAQMKEIVAELGMHMSDARIQEFLDVMQGTLDAYDIVDSLPDYLPPVLYPRTSGHRPTPDENPMNAWYVKTEIKGAPRGPLLGRTVALKDNVCLAGVPMMNGASTLKGYTPDIDATIVTRLLDAGATIVGKAHCEYFCLSGGSHTNATGAVHNPHKQGYSAGGSSSGSGALVGAGLVDMAIGGDQGGSIRMPASFCGVYGMKPTHGLVPYSGIMPIENTIDHAGPMTQTVMDNALMLEVIAGADGLDPRQYDVRTDRYTASVNRGASGLRIGVVKEGFGHEQSEADVDAKVRAGAELFRKLGATVDDISIPWHLHGPAIWTPIGLEGLTNQMMIGNGFGTGWEGLYTTSLLDYHSNWRSRADELSDTLKISMFVGQYHLKHTRGRYYAKAQNLARQLREEYNKVLASYDLLLMPTTPMKATPLPPPDSSLALWTQRAFEMLPNTAPFDVTGHPAMSIPCGMSDGLPVGLQLIGRRYEESTIYRAAGAFEQAGDWRQM